LLGAHPILHVSRIRVKPKEIRVKMRGEKSIINIEKRNIKMTK
jgi:hypothetical protein